MKKITLFLLCIVFHFVTNAQDFVTRWDLSIGGSGATQLTFGVGTTGTCSYTWETIPAGANGSGTFNGTITITGLPAGATIRLNIDTANFRSIHFDMGLMPDRRRLKDVEQWGDVKWNTMSHAFYNCENLNITSLDIPDLSGVTNMTRMFSKCSSLNGPANINSWNVSNVSNMYEMFFGDTLFNQPVGNWNTANVTNMHGMFWSAKSFNQALDSWNTTSVTNMSQMFSGAVSFNQPIGNWNTSNVTNMGSMFYYATSFNQAIGGWNTGNVTDLSFMLNHAFSFSQPIGNWNTTNVLYMQSLFAEATLFNQPIGGWNTGNVTNMAGMFQEAVSFDQAIGNWNTANVTSMYSMFSEATLFNQAIGNWNTTNVQNMYAMFANDTTFNQPIGNWNTTNVTSMAHMFLNATSFNQPIGNWNTSNVTNMESMFLDAHSFNQPLGNWNLNPIVILEKLLDNSGFDCASYGATLAGWHNNVNTPYNRVLGAKYIKLLINAQVDRDYLVNTKGWTINGDAQTFNNCCMIVNSSFTQSGTTLTANANFATYQWLTCNPYQDIIGETSQSYTNIIGGYFAVAVTQNGCTDTSSCVAVSALGLNSADFSNAINIFPNPVQQKLQIKAEHALQNANIKVLNITGQVVDEFKNISATEFIIDMSSFVSGHYFIQINDGQNKYVRKIFKE